MVGSSNSPRATFREAYQPPKDAADKDLFADKAIPGLLGRQTAQQLHYLFEVIEAPTPYLEDLPVTIGVARVDGANQSSEYEIVELILPAT